MGRRKQYKLLDEHQRKVSSILKIMMDDQLSTLPPARESVPLAFIIITQQRFRAQEY